MDSKNSPATPAAPPALVNFFLRFFSKANHSNAVKMGSGYSKNLGGETSNTSVLNSNNVGEDLMAEATDVVVVGAGIHSLMYAIHTSKLDQKHGRDGISPISGLECRYKSKLIYSRKCFSDSQVTPIINFRCGCQNSTII